MSLFDVIKYPISIPPTKEELEVLPDEILIEWGRFTIYSTVSGRNKQNIINYYTSLPLLVRDKAELMKLKDIIKEWP